MTFNFIVRLFLLFVICFFFFLIFFFQAEDGIRDLVRSRGLGDVYKRQTLIDTWTKRDRDDGRHNGFLFIAKVLNLAVSCQLSAISIQLSVEFSCQLPGLAGRTSTATLLVQVSSLECNM